MLFYYIHLPEYFFIHHSYNSREQIVRLMICGCTQTPDTLDAHLGEEIEATFLEVDEDRQRLVLANKTKPKNVRQFRVRPPWHVFQSWCMYASCQSWQIRLTQQA